MNPTKSDTQQDLGQRIGCHYSHASRILSGNRLPSLYLFDRLVEEYNLDSDEALREQRKGAEAFGAYILPRVMSDTYLREHLSVKEYDALMEKRSQTPCQQGS